MEYATLEKGRVWNNGAVEHVEGFNGVEIRIPPKGYIEMDFKEAVAFKSQFYELVKNSSTGNEVKNKPLRVEKFLVKVPKASAEAPKNIDAYFRCMACPVKGGKHKDFDSEAEYEAHIAQSHQHLMLDKTAKEELQKKSA